MDRKTALALLDTLIDYFQTGNQETDAVAKAIVRADFDREQYWDREISRYLAGPDWSGIRSPEAEIIAAALSELKKQLRNG